MDGEGEATRQQDQSESGASPETAAALAAYQAFIDACVQRARASWAAQRLRDNVPFEQPVGEQQRHFNQLLQALSGEQRAAIADLLLGERQAALGDLLSFMTWKGVQIVQGGIALPWEPYGTEARYDFICRMEGDPWPDERATQPQSSPP